METREINRSQVTTATRKKISSQRQIKIIWRVFEKKNKKQPAFLCEILFLLLLLFDTAIVLENL